ncbi:hypothetical protein Scep_029844 [Stephania cephalantha]|uniref:Uncharacterized protein n=1 Tax=Stephania cephalantha TaxID=152367 RepID=A0AAP0E1S8_9MAGN
MLPLRRSSIVAIKHRLFHWRLHSLAAAAASPRRHRAFLDPPRRFSSWADPLHPRAAARAPTPPLFLAGTLSSAPRQSAASSRALLASRASRRRSRSRASSRSGDPRLASSLSARMPSLRCVQLQTTTAMLPASDHRDTATLPCIAPPPSCSAGPSSSSIAPCRGISLWFIERKERGGHGGGTHDTGEEQQLQRHTTPLRKGKLVEAGMDGAAGADGRRRQGAAAPGMANHQQWHRTSGITRRRGRTSSSMVNGMAWCDDVMAVARNKEERKEDKKEREE